MDLTETAPALQRVLDDVETVCPSTTATSDAPLDRVTGMWFVDLKTLDRHVVVKWGVNSKFGVLLATLEAGYGEAPDASFKTEDEAVREVVRLLTA